MGWMFGEKDRELAEYKITIEQQNEALAQKNEALAQKDELIAKLMKQINGG